MNFYAVFEVADQCWTFAEGCGSSPCLFRDRQGAGARDPVFWARQSQKLHFELQTRFGAWCWSPGSSLVSVVCCGLSPAQHQPCISAVWPTESNRLVLVAPTSWFFHALLFNDTFSLFLQDSSSFLLSLCHLRTFNTGLADWVLTILCVFAFL